MSPLSILVNLAVFGFPLVLIFVQWMLIRRRLPWVGLLVSLIPIILIGLIGFVLPLTLGDCRQNSCEWAGLGLLFIEGYAVAVAIISSGAGFLIKLVYRKQVWKPDEFISKKWKIPSLVLMGVVFGFGVCFVLVISGVINGLPGVETVSYP